MRRPVIGDEAEARVPMTVVAVTAAKNLRTGTEEIAVEDEIGRTVETEKETPEIEMIETIEIIETIETITALVARTPETEISSHRRHADVMIVATEETPETEAATETVTERGAKDQTAGTETPVAAKRRILSPVTVATT
jgi:hypothetical protein